MTAPVQEPTDPSVSATELAMLSSLVQALLQDLTVTALLELLGSFPGVSIDSVKTLLEVRPEFANRVRRVPPAPPLAPDSVQSVARTNLVRRAQYLLNAARRVSTSGDLRKAIDDEFKHFKAHLEATRKREVAGEKTAQAETQYGPILGWYAILDEATTADCRRMDGKNFRAGTPPTIGYPGAVHVHCRCTPGKPHLDAQGRVKAPHRRARGSEDSGLVPDNREASEVAAMNKYPDDVGLIELAKTSGSLLQMAGKLGVSRVSLTNYLLRRPILDSAVRSQLKSRAGTIELAGPPAAVREKAAKKGNALSDGSFPIRNLDDLKKAIRAFGRAKPEHKDAVKRLIKRRARELGAPDLVPDNWVSLAADHKSSTHPDPPNKPGMNWIEKIGGHLPPFIKRVAKHIMADSGYTQSRAIAAAISQCKKGRLGPKGLAAAAQWEALKARAHAHSNDAGAACEAIELATYSTEQLRSYYKAPPPKGKPAAKKKGGTAAPATSGGKKRVVRTDAGARRYKVPIGTEIGKARDAAGAEAQKNVTAVGNYKKAVGAGDRDKQVAGLTPKDLQDLSRVAFSFRSSDPSVVALRMSVVRELTKRGMDPKQFGYLGGSSAKTPNKKLAVRAPVRKPVKKSVSNLNRMKVQ